MTQAFAIADVGALVGDPSRAAMLMALMDGRARSSGELASCAQITPAAASMHLGKLMLGGLLAVQKQGRHRYYRLANERVSAAIEALGLIATRVAPPTRPVSARQSALFRARTCYDHLAGEFAVTLRGVLEQKCVIVEEGNAGYRITPSGAAWFHEHFDIEADALARARRATARQCIDWTERQPHIAGALGARILDYMLRQRWFVATDAPRILRVTDRGRAALRRLGVSG